MKTFFCQVVMMILFGVIGGLFGYGMDGEIKTACTWAAIASVVSFLLVEVKTK